MSSSLSSMSMRFMATVTISVPDARMACSITSLELNFPVPRKRRELNSRPAITNFSTFQLFYLIIRFMFKIFRVSAAGSSARRIVPESAIPFTPVSSMAGISSQVIPPMATTGSSIFASFI